MRRMYSKNQLAQEVQNVVSSGELENVKIFENIVDKDGHKRFIEGDINIPTLSGVTKTYGKWSLSGSHLILVLCGDVADDTILGSLNFGITDNLPKWVLDKIIPVYASNSIESKNINIYADDYSSQSVTLVLQKRTNDLVIYLVSLTATKDRHFRFVFDLLIDTE